MNHDPNTFVFVVQSAFLELLELTERVAQCDCPEKQESFREEAEKTILMFIAAIILGSREYRPAERSFLSLLVNWQDKPGGEARYLNEYATRWTETAKDIPQFFATAVRHDLLHRTAIARAMLCQIQLVGNNACVADGNACGARRDVVKEYLVLLEEYLELQYAQATAVDGFTNDQPDEELPSDEPSIPQTEDEPQWSGEAQTTETGGSIGYFRLTSWWSAEFSDEERAYIVSLYSGSEAKSLTKGTIRPNERLGYGYVEHSSGLGFYLGSCADFLMKLADRLDVNSNYALNAKIIKKLIEQVEAVGGDLIDKHHAFGWMAKRFFKERKFDQHAEQRTIWACVKQIELAPEVKKLIRIVNGWGTVIDSPHRHITIWHEGYGRLANLLEKEKKFGAVVALCEQALEQGWVGTDWKTKLLKCNVYAASEDPPSKILPDLPELRWDDALIRESRIVSPPPVEEIPCPIPRYEMCLTNGVLAEMNSEQRVFYRELAKSIEDRSFLPVHGQSEYLNYYIRDNFRAFDKQTLERLYAELLLLGEAYKTEAGIYWRPVDWSYDCLLALEAYDRFFEVTKPANIFSIRTHFANLKCSVRYYLGTPASGIDFLQMYGARLTKTTKQHPQEFEKFVDMVFAEGEKLNGSWYEQILAGSDRIDYQIRLFPMLHFARRSKIPNYCFYHCSDAVSKRISEAFREAENRLRQHLGEKNVGEQWTDEAELFYAIKRAFPQFQVIHHGRPDWLGQMHLDVWIPELKVAIEYHGPQHFEAMEHYGGAEALEATKKRDALKRAACERMGVQMLEVTSLDQVSAVIGEITRIADGKNEHSEG